MGLCFTAAVVIDWESVRAERGQRHYHAAYVMPFHSGETGELLIKNRCCSHLPFSYALLMKMADLGALSWFNISNVLYPQPLPKPSFCSKNERHISPCNCVLLTETLAFWGLFNANISMLCLIVRHKLEKEKCLDCPFQITPETC